MADSLDLEATIRRISAFGLPGRNRDPELPAIGSEDWSRFLGSLRTNRITGFAVAAAEARWQDLTTEQTEALLEAHRQAMLTPLGVERSLLEIATEFESSDVEFVVLKGPALAHTVYPNPSWRFFGDLDLLVRGVDWAKSSKILEGLGYTRSLPEPRVGFDKRFGKAAEFQRTGGVEVDLHRTLVVGPFGLWIEPDALFENTTTLDLWNRPFRRFDDSLLQLHACMHASLGWWPPLKVPIRDVAQVALCGNVDWEVMYEWAARWKLRAVVRDALQTASDTLGVDLGAGAESAMGQRASRKERRALQSYVDGHRDQGGTALWTLKAIHGVRAKIAYLRALILPNREFLAIRSGSPRGSYLHRWRIPIRWVLGRWRVRRRSHSR